jgi:hypothetical protein
MPKTFSKISPKISMSVFPRFFPRVFGCFSAMGVQNTKHKNVLQKYRVEKFLQKIRPKIQNRLFFDFLNHVFGGFSVRGVKKHDKKISEKNKSDPSLFLASYPPTHHGGHDFLAAP